MTVVNVHEAKTSLSKLIDRAHAGEEITIAKAGKPWARIVPLAATQPRQPGGFSFDVPDDFDDPLPQDELGAWEGNTASEKPRSR